MSLAIRVIPCLDVHDGRVVKGVNFRNLRDAGDPVDLAAAYGAEGADELVFLDISASSDGRATTYDMVRRTAETVFIPLCVGGGVRGVADVDTLLRSGADKVGINTGAITRPEAIDEIAERFGNQVLVLSVDARRVQDGAAPTPSGFEVTTHGGRRGTGIDEGTLAHKTALIEAALARTGDRVADPVERLAALGAADFAAAAGATMPSLRDHKASVGTGGLALLRSIGGASTLCPAISSYNFHTLLARGSPLNGEPKVTTALTRSGCARASARANTPPRLHPTISSGWSGETTSIRARNRSTMSAVAPMFQPSCHGCTRQPPPASARRNSIVVRSLAMKPGMTSAGGPSPGPRGLK